MLCSSNAESATHCAASPSPMRTKARTYSLPFLDLLSSASRTSEPKNAASIPLMARAPLPCTARTGRRARPSGAPSAGCAISPSSEREGGVCSCFRACSLLFALLVLDLGGTARRRPRQGPCIEPLLDLALGPGARIGADHP